ncbi:unnamed protein product, partial [Mesorhabditis spiculigera]
MSTKAESSSADDIRRSKRKSCPSDVMKTRCAVTCCGNTEDSKTENGKFVEFFGLPDKHDKETNRKQWVKNVRGIAGMLPYQQKICSVHFVDGHPTKENPVPTLLLSKRKIVPGPEAKKPRSIKEELFDEDEYDEFGGYDEKAHSSASTAPFYRRKAPSDPNFMVNSTDAKAIFEHLGQIRVKGDEGCCRRILNGMRRQARYMNAQMRMMENITQEVENYKKNPGGVGGWALNDYLARFGLRHQQGYNPETRHLAGYTAADPAALPRQAAAVNALFDHHDDEDENDEGGPELDEFAVEDMMREGKTDTENDDEAAPDLTEEGQDSQAEHQEDEEDDEEEDQGARDDPDDSDYHE